MKGEIVNETQCYYVCNLLDPHVFQFFKENTDAKTFMHDNVPARRTKLTNNDVLTY